MLLDEVAGDDEEEARRKYRDKRVAELKAAAAAPQYGEVINITATEYVVSNPPFLGTVPILTCPRRVNAH